MAIKITSGSVGFRGRIKVARVFYAPTDISLTNSTVSELASNGTVIGIASAADLDIGDIFTWSLTDNAGGRFAINMTTGELYVNSPLDYETNQTHNITIRVDDSHGFNYSENFVVTVTDEVENSPPTDITLNTNTASRWARTITTASAVDPDVGDTATWSLVADSSGKYDINSSTGVITPEAYPVPVGQNSITIRATDTASNIYNEAFVLESLIANNGQRLQASDPSLSDWFGWSVALSSDGNTLMVTSVTDDNSGGVDAGSAYIFNFNA